MNVKDNNKGSVILYATFLMLVLGAIAMLTAFVVFLNIKATANSTNAIVAYYAAESGLETNLGEIKRARDEQSVSLTYALQDHDTDLDVSGASFSTTASNQVKTELVFDLSVLESEQIDLYVPDTGESLISSGSGSIYIDWEKADSDTCTDGALEFSIKEFNVSSWDDVLLEDQYWVETPSCCTTFSYALSAGYGYRVKISPLYCDLADITFKVVDDSGADVGLPNYIVVESEGSYGQSSVKLQAETIWKPHMSGLGEYVLFSEEIICKGDTCT